MKTSITEKIEEIFECTQLHLIDNCCVRVNAPDVNLDIRAGTMYLDINNRAIIVIGPTFALNFYGNFEFVEPQNIIVVSKGHQKITVYLSTDARVEECFRYYETVYLNDLKEEELNAQKH